MNLPEPAWAIALRSTRAERRNGIALIFDEVITGFRLGMGGAQQHFGVTPDLAVFGKAMANGYPISVLAGKRDWMRLIAEGKVIHAGTMNSGQPSVAAALATLEVLERDFVHERLFSLGQRLMEGIRQVAQETGHSVLVQGLGPMFHVGFTTQTSVRDCRDAFCYDKPKYAAFVLAMQERGVLVLPAGGTVIRFLPPILIEDAQLDEGIEAMAEALRLAG